MSEKLLRLLRDYRTEASEADQIEYPIQAPPGLHRTLIVTGDNLDEMWEEAADGGDSIRLYVAERMAEAQDLSAAEVWKSLVDVSLEGSGLPAADKADLHSIYEAYAALWTEQSDLLNEALVPVTEQGNSAAEQAWPGPAWVQQNQEDGLLLLDLPEADAWTAPLIVPMGGYNECPQPTEQAVLFRDWQKRYGTVPTAVTGDSWLLKASRLPKSDEEALELAREHFMFCSYVLERFSSIGQYASDLKRNTAWHFWWD